MDAFLDLLLALWGHLVGWRTWLCVIVALIVAYILSARGIAFNSASATFIAFGILGFVVGIFWDARTP